MRAGRPIWIAVACLGGCSLLIDSGELVEGSSTPIEGGAGSGASGGGGSSGQGGGAGGSSGTSDVGVPDQNGDTGGPDSDADPGPFCASLNPAPTLCSDFDLQDLPAGWDGVGQWGGCQAVLDSDASVSPPRSLSVTSPALADGEQCAAALEGKFPQPSSAFVVEFDLFVEAFDSQAWVFLAQIELSGAEGDDVLILRMRANELGVVEDGTLSDGGKLYSSHASAKVPAVGQWSHVRWEISFGGSTAFSNLNVDGTSSGESAHAKTFLGPVDVKVGLVGIVGPLQPHALRYDNVVVDVL